MRIKKSLLGITTAVMAAMAFASPAMATDGKFRDVTGTSEMSANRELHLIGWKKFVSAGGSFACHITVLIKTTTASTGHVTSITVPDTTKCAGTGLLNGCQLKSHQTTNLPYHVTVTDSGRIFISGSIVFDNEYSSCLVRTTKTTFSSIELIPLKTGERAVTGTTNHLGETAGLNEAIAGFEFNPPSGKLDIENIFGGKSEETITIPGELELAEPDRCTWEITAN